MDTRPRSTARRLVATLMGLAVPLAVGLGLAQCQRDSAPASEATGQPAAPAAKVGGPTTSIQVMIPRPSAAPPAGVNPTPVASTSPPTAPDLPSPGLPSRLDRPPNRRGADNGGWDPPAAGAGSPSFDCRQASRWSERAICGSADLAAADRRLSRLYFDVRERAQDPDGLLRSQRDFLRRRDLCANAPYPELCLRRTYHQRWMELQDWQ